MYIYWSSEAPGVIVKSPASQAGPQIRESESSQVGLGSSSRFPGDTDDQSGMGAHDSQGDISEVLWPRRGLLGRLWAGGLERMGCHAALSALTFNAC